MREEHHSKYDEIDMKAYKVAQWTSQSEINCYHDYFQQQNYVHTHI